MLVRVNVCVVVFYKLFAEIAVAIVVDVPAVVRDIGTAAIGVKVTVWVVSSAVRNGCVFATYAETAFGAVIFPVRRIKSTDVIFADVAIVVAVLIDTQFIQKQVTCVASVITISVVAKLKHEPVTIVALVCIFILAVCAEFECASIALVAPLVIVGVNAHLKRMLHALIAKVVAISIYTGVSGFTCASVITCATAGDIGDDVLCVLPAVVACVSQVTQSILCSANDELTKRR